MKAAANGVFQLFIDGVLRTEIPTFLSFTWSADHADTQFYLCDVDPNSDQTHNRAMYVYPTAVAGATCGGYVNFNMVTPHNLLKLAVSWIASSQRRQLNCFDHVWDDP